ncbi:MAG: DUF1810 domain-containing protein [Caulobacteraceae bacterium]|nr:DUF1810 domain-containing protein [Caulobacteraceae bacterium]
MTLPSDPLRRFVDAQAGTFDGALAELRAGRKRGHWMWFILPQLAGLGASEMSRRYALENLAEAGAYLAHPLLGPRLRACVRAILSHAREGAQAIFGPVDAMKLRSCLTLFDRASPTDIFADALQTFFGGVGDPETLRRL